MTRAKAFVLAVALALLVAGCSAADRPPTPAPTFAAAVQGAVLELRAAADGSLHATLGPTRLDAEPGALAPKTTLAAAAVTLPQPPPTIDDIEISTVGSGVEAHVRSGRLTGAVTLLFTDAKARDGESVFAVHRADDGTWTSVPSDMTAEGLRVAAASFSAVGWVSGKVLKPVGDFLAAKLAGRTDPPSCAGAPPWASVNSSPSGSTHACIRAGKPAADGTPIVELEVRSNRGTYQWVQVPSTLTREYLWVEDQPDVVRSIIRKAAGRGETVLLAPGRSMTVGYRQPSQPTQLAYRTYVDTTAGFLSAGRLALDAVVDDAVSAAGGYVALFHCLGVLKIDLTNGRNPAELVSPAVFADMVSCSFETVKGWADDPVKAYKAAKELSPGDTEEQLTDTLLGEYRLAKLAQKLSRVISLTSYIAKELAFVVDALNSGLGAQGAGDVTLSLTAKALPVLGYAGWASGTVGFGKVRPKEVFNGGGPTGRIFDITWSSWGPDRAEGKGRAYNDAHSADGTVAGAPEEPATIVAWDVGPCHGRTGFRKVTWFFAGDKWTPKAYSYDICSEGG